MKDNMVENTQSLKELHSGIELCGGKYVIEKKGTYGAVFNASNEVAVNAFLKDQIPFLAIEEIVTTLMKKHQNIVHPSYEQIAEIDAKTRQNAYEMIKKWRKC